MFFASRYYRGRSNTDPKSSNRPVSKPRHSGISDGNSVHSDTAINPKGGSGRTLLCNGCGSYCHLWKNCLDRRLEESGDIFISQEVTEQEIEDAIVDHLSGI